MNFRPPAPLFSKTADAKLNIYFVQPYDFNTKVLTGLLRDRGYQKIRLAGLLFGSCNQKSKLLNLG